MSSSVRREERAGVAFATLDRPSRSNALDLDTVTALRALVAEVAASPDVRAVVLQGAGPAFCAGADLKEFAAHSATPSELADFARQKVAESHELIYELALLPVPVIAAMHGAVAGGGLSLAFASDIRIAAADCQIHFAWPKVGLAPDMGSSHALRALLGPTAIGTLLRRQRLRASDALDLGLVDSIVPSDRLRDAAMQCAEEVAGRFDRDALGVTKRLVRDAGQSLRAALDAEGAETMQLLAGPMFGQMLEQWRS